MFYRSKLGSSGLLLVAVLSLVGLAAGAAIVARVGLEQLATGPQHYGGGQNPTKFGIAFGLLMLVRLASVAIQAAAVSGCVWFFVAVLASRALALRRYGPPGAR